jgi:hypothetical protein
MPAANGGTPSSRSQEFATGHQGEQNPAGHASVLSLKPNDDPATHVMRPEGVLAQLQRSGIGMSSADAQRRFIGQPMPGRSYSGSAPRQQEQLMTLRGVGAPSTPDPVRTSNAS